MTALMLGRDEDPHKSLAFLVGWVFRLDRRFDAEEGDLTNGLRHVGLVLFSQ
jgi:hypothetical protein